MGPQRWFEQHTVVRRVLIAVLLVIVVLIWWHPWGLAI